MDKNEILAKLYEFAAEAFGVDASTLTAETNPAELGNTSQKIVAMSAAIENEFEVMVPVAKFAKFESFDELADFIEEEA